MVVFTLTLSFSAEAGENQKNKQELEVGAGVFVATLPDYIGSDEESTYLLPMPYVYFKTDKIELDRNAFTGHLWRKKRWYLDISAAGSIAVSSKDNLARQNMPDLDWVGELGLSLKYYFIGDDRADEELHLGFRLHKAIATDFSSIDDIGWTYGPSLAYQNIVYPSAISGELTFEAKLSAHFGDSKYLNYYYGVNEQYQAYDRLAFSANSGYGGSSLSTGFTWKKDQLWLASYVKYYTLAGSEQKNSPLVKSNDNWAYGLALVWIFYQQ